MSRDDTTSSNQTARPLVTQLTSEQLRDLPASAPALAPEPALSDEVVFLEERSSVRQPDSPPTEREPESLPASRTLREEITRRVQKDQRFSVDEARQIGQQLCQSILAQTADAWKTPIRPESVAWSDTGMVGFCETENADNPTEFTFGERDQQRDVAAILYELLTGSVPREPLVAPHELRKNVPTRMSQAIVRALAVEPGRRFATLKEFQKHLASPSAKPRQRLEMAAILGIALLVTAGLIWWSATRPHPKPEDKIQFAQQLVLVEDARKQAEQVDADILTEAKRTADEVDKWQREVINAQESKKRLQEEYAQQRLAQALPAHEIASQVGEIWKKHGRRTTWSSEAGGHLARAKALADSDRFDEALKSLKECETAVQFPLQWRENARAAVALTKTVRQELDEHQKKATGQPGTPYAAPLRMLAAVPNKLAQEDGQSALADLRFVQQSLARIETLIALRAKVSLAAKQSDEVAEIQEARSEVARVENLVHQGDDQLSQGNFTQAEQTYETAIRDYQSLPLTAIKALIALAEAKNTTDSAAVRLTLIDAVFRIKSDSKSVALLHAKAYRLRAEAYLVLGKLSEALKACDESIERDQLQATAFLVRSAVRIQQGQFALAINDCDRALQLNNALPEAFLRRGIAKFRLQNWDAALADLTQALHHNPKLTEALTARGTILLRQGQVDRALADFNDSLKFEPSQPVALAERAKLHRGQREFDLARQDCDAALKLQPAFAEAYLVRSSIWVSLKEFDRALADLDLAQRQQPQLATIELSRGEIWLLKSDYQKSVTAFTAALRLDANLIEAYHQRGQAWLKLLQWDKALADFNEALLRNPRALETYLLRASVWSAKGDAEKAAADYTQALRLDSQNLVALLGRAKACLVKGDVDRALQDATAALKLDPGSLPLLRIRAAAALKTKAYDQAIADLNAVLKVESKSLDDLVQRGVAWLEKGDPDKALADCDAALKLDANCIRAYETRSKVWFKKGDASKAMNDYNTALRLSQKPAKSM